MSSTTLQVRVDGKFFRIGNLKWFLKGFSYGPFAPNSDGEHLPQRCRLLHDLDHIRELGATALRVYIPPPRWVLDEAYERSLRVFVDVPWEKHRCFFEDWHARRRARNVVEQTARELGQHPGCFAISVANEFPNDVVRFYGAERVSRFVNELVDVVKQTAPQCLATFVNFPTTEFLSASDCDFHCFNVYVHDSSKLGEYFDRLHHIAGDRPLVLGEFGLDSQRHGEEIQRELLASHLEQVTRRGLAGSVVFSYTDDWYTGGRQIEDWKFGVTSQDRIEKPSALAVREAWDRSLEHVAAKFPKASVVVCCYNGAETLRECLNSLMNLNYPDYEVILVDDGSTDESGQIAQEFPQVVYIHQANRGLSAARNMGAEQAGSEIVAYTDADCVADEDWLLYLVQALEDQPIAAVGGPNISPPSDGWVAKCVAVSPGNPSHVMLDDRYAEHVPGCNMALRRSVMLGLGGFDPQFRQAGDDVDFFWRLLDAGMHIGFAPAAMVWHHRRATVRAYLKQQRGYGSAEAAVQLKHPQRCGAFGRFTWKGIIYGDGMVGLPLLPPLIYHGRFGGALFQSIYQQGQVSSWAYVLSLEWYALALLFIALGTLYGPLAALSLLMVCASAAVALDLARRAPLPRRAPWWCRPLTAGLYILQPIVRSWHRYAGLQRSAKLPNALPLEPARLTAVKRISSQERDLYWHSDQGVGRELLLAELLSETKRLKWLGDFDNHWVPWDLLLVGDRWHSIAIHTVTEELVGPKRFTRARLRTRPTLFQRVLVASILAWSLVALLTVQPWAMILGGVAALAALLRIAISRRQCLRATTALVANAAEIIRLPVYPWHGQPLGEVGMDAKSEPQPKLRRRRLMQVGS